MKKQELQALLDKMLNWFKVNEERYLITDFLLENNVTEKEFKEACLVNGEDIERLYYMARTYEKNRIVKGMLDKKMNGFSCESYLKNEHDWKEKDYGADAEESEINSMLKGIRERVK